MCSGHHVVEGGPVLQPCMGKLSYREGKEASQGCRVAGVRW